MKKEMIVKLALIFGGILILLFLLGYYQFTGMAVSEKELLAYYNFNDGFVDLSGNGNHGTVVGDVNFAEGKFGNALKLNGKAYVDIGQELSDMGTYGGEKGSSTIVAWIKPSSPDKYNVITLNVGGFGYLSAGKEPRGYRKRVVAQVYNSALRGDYLGESFNPIEAEKWTHVAMVLEGGDKYTIYINGRKDGSYGDGYFRLNNYGGRAYIGQGFDANSYFDGLIDELRIYKGALSEKEIVSLYQKNS